jgi:hypothetical protein
MIKIIQGTYGHLINGIVKPKTSADEPFELSEAQEKRLVDLGVAVYVDGGRTKLPEGVALVDYNVNMKATELREIAKGMGLTFPVGTTKAEMVEAMDKYLASENAAENGADEPTEDAPIGFDEIPPEDFEGDEDAPTFDATEAVE